MAIFLLPLVLATPGNGPISLAGLAVMGCCRKPCSSRASQHSCTLQCIQGRCFGVDYDDYYGAALITLHTVFLTPLECVCHT
eukprot:456214-Pelagomonas_calceolata.AAC.9